MQLPSGIGVALVTPFNEDLSIDMDSLGNLLDFLIHDSKVDFIVVTGTTAETPTLSSEERIKIWRFVSEYVKDTVPLVAGIGGNNTQAVVKEMKDFPFPDRYCAFLSVTPYYNKPTQQGLIKHYTALSRSSPLPIILYNVPGRTGVHMQADTVFELSKHDSIKGLKEASGNILHASELMAGIPQDFKVYSGDDALNYLYFALGMHGTISVSAHLAAVALKNMFEYVQKGNLADARKIHFALAKFHQLLFVEGNPVGIKCALLLSNLIKTPLVRPPLVSASSQLTEELNKTLSELKNSGLI